MTRSKVHGQSKLPKSPTTKLLQEVIQDVILAQGMAHDEWRKLWTDPFTSLSIPTVSGSEYPCTQAGVDAAHKLTAQTWEERVDLRQTIARETFDRISFTAIGQTIGSSSSHLPYDLKIGSVGEEFFAALVADYKSNLDVLAGSARADFYCHIPCHLFDINQGVAAFSVGPVEFSPRAVWIAKHVRCPLALERVQQVESGLRAIQELQSEFMKAAAPADVRDAWSILTFLGSYSWVATICMPGHDLTQSHHKATLLVGLAIDIVGLRFHVQQSRRFAKAGRQHLYSEARLATDENGKLLRGSMAQLAGLGGAPGALAAKMIAEQPFLDQAGEVLSAFVKGRNAGKAPHLIERWANALYWFGEARREASDFMAVVDYGCAADGLSNAGGASSKMIAFAEAALNPGSRPAPAGTLSISGAVRRVYAEGRNKLAHGEVSGLFEDQSESRSVGDGLVGSLLCVLTQELAFVLKNRTHFLTLSEEHAYRGLLERLRQRT